MELIQAWYNQIKQAKCFQLRRNLSKLNNSNYQINVLYAKLSLSMQVVMNPQFGAPNFVLTNFLTSGEVTATSE